LPLDAICWGSRWAGPAGAVSAAPRSRRLPLSQPPPAEPTPLPTEFLARLAQSDTVLVTSRDGSREGTVRAWFVVSPPGVVYLFTSAVSVKAVRWRADSWVRLTVPGGAASAEGRVHLVPQADVDLVAPLIVERWGMWGATTPEGLKRLIRDGEYVLVRVEG